MYAQLRFWQGYAAWRGVQSCQQGGLGRDVMVHPMGYQNPSGHLWARLDTTGGYGSKKLYETII